MNPTIRPAKVLDYYDGVLVFTAEGDNGQQYVGSIIDTTDGIDRYLVKATTPEQISNLKNGKVDLRSLLLENPDDDWFLTFDGDAPDQPLVLHPQEVALKCTDFLPSEGYFLNDEFDKDTRLTENGSPSNGADIGKRETADSPESRGSARRGRRRPCPAPSTFYEPHRHARG